MRICQVDLQTIRMPLKGPYVLSFATLTEIVSQLVRVVLADGQAGFGEAVALPGYSGESQGSIRAALRSIVPRLPGMEVRDASRLVRERLAEAPFARSAVLTAVELAAGMMAVPQRVEIPLLAPIATAAPAEMIDKSRALLRAGYETLKVKIGRDVDADIRGARALLEHLPDSTRLRFDANQAYNPAAAGRFLSSLEHPKNGMVELVEQPLPPCEWKEMGLLAKQSLVPLMLDESIYSVEDVRRAAEIGVRLVKLKLCKQAGISDLLSAAREARSLGLGVVLGNGVASDVGNLAEAWAYAAAGGAFQGAGEMNGFIKVRECLLANPPRLVEGCLNWTMPESDGQGAMRPGAALRQQGAQKWTETC